jgi:hypothetical protein
MALLLGFILFAKPTGATIGSYGTVTQVVSNIQKYLLGLF